MIMIIILSFLYLINHWKAFEYFLLLSYEFNCPNLFLSFFLNYKSVSFSLSLTTDIVDTASSFSLYGELDSFSFLNFYR